MLAHTITGSGPALLLIHGFCEDRTLWSSYTVELSKEFKVICPDLPGFGESAPEFAEAVTMEYYAKRVHELLDTILERGERTVLVGHSLGGYVALAFADLYPERIKGIGLFHSTAFADNEEKKLSRDKVAAYIQQKGVAAFTDNFIEPLFYVANRERLMHAIEQLKKQAAISSKEGVIAAIMGMKERVERIDVLTKLACPVLFIIGKSDTSVTIDKSLEQCHLAAQSLVFVLDKVGHMGMLEEEEKCLAVLNSFAHLCNQGTK